MDVQFSNSVSKTLNLSKIIQFNDFILFGYIISESILAHRDKYYNIIFVLQNKFFFFILNKC